MNKEVNYEGLGFRDKLFVKKKKNQKDNHNDKYNYWAIGIIIIIACGVYYYVSQMTKSIEGLEKDPSKLKLSGVGNLGGEINNDDL